MEKGLKIKLSVPGTEDRYGTYCEDLGFDDMCRVHLIGFHKKGKAKKYKEPHFYLAHKEHVFQEGVE